MVLRPSLQLFNKLTFGKRPQDLALDVIPRGRIQRRRQLLCTGPQETEDTKGMRHMQEEEKYVKKDSTIETCPYGVYLVRCRCSTSIT